jgi:hypothetical protein
MFYFAFLLVTEAVWCRVIYYSGLTTGAGDERRGCARFDVVSRHFKVLKNPAENLSDEPNTISFSILSRTAPGPTYPDIQ